MLVLKDAPLDCWGHGSRGLSEQTLFVCLIVYFFTHQVDKVCSNSGSFHSIFVMRSGKTHDMVKKF